MSLPQVRAILGYKHQPSLGLSSGYNKTADPLKCLRTSSILQKESILPHTFSEIMAHSRCHLLSKYK
jgi:hypothetical protein